MKHKIEFKVACNIADNQKAHEMMRNITNDLGNMMKETFTELNEAGITSGTEMTFSGGIEANSEFSPLNELIRDYLTGKDMDADNDNVKIFRRKVMEHAKSDMESTRPEDFFEKVAKEAKKDPASDDEDTIYERMEAAFEEQEKKVGKQEIKNDEYLRALFNGMEIMRAARDDRPTRFILPTK